MTRSTTTGGVLEQMILPALTRGGYLFNSQVQIGTKFTGENHRHFVDVVARKGDESFLISLKWQQTSGTAEEKVPFEVICLMDAIQKNNGLHKRAYLVLGGDGWKLRNFYISNEFKKYIPFSNHVTILTLESFIAVANRAQL
jgi:hypothetical protein